MTNQELRKQYELIRLVDSRIRKNPLSECAKDASEMLADAKRKVRRFVKDQANRHTEIKMFSCARDDLWLEMHDIEFDGSKNELVTQLENLVKHSRATVQAQGRDCTGLSFISGYKAAHVTGNRYKVLYEIQLDV